MKLIDVIALAKAGYSKKEIEKIKSEESENGEEVNNENETSVIVETETDDEKAEDDSDDFDYKALYENANEKLIELEEKILILQKANTDKNLSENEKSFNDKVKDSLNALI